MRRTLLFAFLFSVGLEAASSDARIAYEKALALEEASGRLDEAIALFQKVVAQASSDDALAAQAQLHVGICYEKLARREARQAYQTVLEKYPSQQETARIARERLARLTASAVPPRAMAVREFQRSAAATPGRLAEPADEPSEFATSDGVRFFYTDWNTGDLVVKDFASGRARALFGVDWSRSSEYFEAPVISPDGRRVGFTTYTYGDRDAVRIEIAAAAGAAREALCETETGGFYTHDWSPDGSLILISQQSADRSWSLVTVHTKTRRIERLVALGWDYPLRAQFSPDGRTIAYDSDKDGNRKIYVITSDGRQEHVLVDSPGEDDSPVWSADGRFVVFRSDRSGDWDLLALPVRDGKGTGDPILVKANIGVATFLRSMTPDGKLFYGEHVGGGDTFLVDRKDGRLASARKLPKMGTRAIRDLSFAPDGRRVAYQIGARNAGRRSLRMAELDGKVLKEFPVGSEYRFPRRPVFSPDGLKFAMRALDRRFQGVVLVFSPETGALLKVLRFEQRGFPFVSGWSTDGRCLYVAVGGEEGQPVSLLRVDVATDERTAIALPARAIRYNVTVSPDGRLLLFRVNTKAAPGDGQPLQLVLRNLADGAERVLRTDVLAGRVLWDADSRHVVYRKAREQDRVYRCSIETGVEEILVSGAAKHDLQDISPDGRLLAFSDRGSDARIWVVENLLPARSTAAAVR